jgi:hypothetical protein
VLGRAGGKYPDTYNSTIIVSGGRKPQRYTLKNLIRSGEFFRIVEAARLCSAPDAGTVFLAFETPFVGAMESFAIVQYSPRVITVQGLPVADQGRIVVQSPTEVDLWTAAGEWGIDLGGIVSDAAPKRYAVRACHLEQQGVRCSSSTKMVGPVSPDTFMAARIKIR